MAFYTQPDGLILWPYIVSYQQGVIGPGMTLNASHTRKVQCLVGQPFMLLQNIRVYFIREQLVVIDIRVTVQANGIIIRNDILDFVVRPRADLVIVRIVTHPAIEVFTMLGSMHTFLKLSFDFFKIELFILGIIRMTIVAGVL
jgi:hypothetical protein